MSNTATTSTPPLRELVDKLQLYVAAPTPMEISAALRRVIAVQSSSDAPAVITKIPLAVVESPYRGLLPSIAERYAERCCWDCMMRGEAPYASHLLYTRFLKDTDEEQRLLGMILGRVWIRAANLLAVYVDLGISDGMSKAIHTAETIDLPVQYRRINP